MYRKPYCLVGITFLLSIVLFGAGCSAQSVSPTHLRCEYVVNPLAVNTTHPRLSWELKATGRDVRQVAYRIIVASSLEKLKHQEGDLWDTKKVNSNQTLNIVYAGKPLQSRQTCYWQVKVWTNDGRESNWSTPAQWSEGLLQPADWQAKWIGLDTFFSWDRPHDVHTRLSARYFRKEFTLPKTIQSAKIYISGLGIYQLFLNGKKVGKEELSPDPTQYDKRIFYNTFDVSTFLRPGKNAIGVILGNGRFYAMRWGKSGLPAIAHYGYPKMIVQLEITYTDGSRQIIKSDNSWKVTADGPIRANNEYDGEIYDATKELTGWDRVGYDDHHWLTAQYTQPPSNDLEAQMDPLITMMDTVKPKSIYQIAPGKYVFDMGQNMVGWVEIHIPQGKTGDTVTLRFAERLNPDSTLYTANLRSAEATDQYIMKAGAQHWQPHFTYHGFRFVELTGYPGKPDLSTLVGKVVYDDLPITGHFESSNTLLNQIYHNAFWGIRGNYRGMPTDCPQRDERMGWLGDRAEGSYGESFIFDNNTLYAKWLQDIQDAQREDGSIPDVAPTYWRVYSDNMTWPGAYPIITHMLYHQFANEQPIIQHYASIKKWLQYMRSKYLKDGIMSKDTYGDWCMPPENLHLIHSKDPSRITPGDLLATAFYYHILKLMQNFAELQHFQKDAQEFAQQADSVKWAFNQHFLNRQTHEYANNTATANIFALAFHLAPDSIRHAVFQHIIDKTENDFDGHISVGLVGAQQFMRTLTRNGRADLAYQIATNTTYPSWGYMVENGATTIWELWNGNTADPAMNSGNHVMLLGDLVIWMYEDLGGIRSDDQLVGFKKIIMKPHFVRGLDWVKSSYQSVCGEIKSAWKKDNQQLIWDIQIPANTIAEVYFPVSSPTEVVERHTALAQVKGVHQVKQENGYVIAEIGSGNYHFVMQHYSTK
ncbi:MAG: glycoside hydrolase family 78 protein [Thermoflavifilum sp.]|nr:glycoside hydrolase family 78 protein [Thermoflavifilum sp.]